MKLKGLILIAGLAFSLFLALSAIARMPEARASVIAVNSEGVTDEDSQSDQPSGLRGFLEEKFSNLKNSILGALTGITDNFISSFRRFFWKTAMPTILKEGADFLFRNKDPLASADMQNPNTTPYPLSLVNWVYQNPPNLGTADSLAYVFGDNLLRIKPVLATTPGRERLNPVISLWAVVRNLSYLLIVIVLILYGFMVMFRYKIDPRTVATAQAALPKLALALIFITFSYTIAALAIDLAQLLLNVVLRVFSDLANQSRLTCGPNDVCVPFYQDPLHLQEGFGTNLNIQLPQFGTSYGWLANWLADFVVNFAVWYLFFHLFFTLIIRYASIFILAVFGPFAIALGIIPGQNDTLRRWLFGLLSNALVFPGIYFLINLAVFVSQTGTNVTLPEPIESVSGSLSGLLVIGFLVAATRVPAYIEEALNVVPSGHTARAGVDFAQAIRRTPFVGGFF